MSERNLTTLTTYTFTWTQPAVLNGELRQYELTCQPVGGGASILTKTFDPTQTTGDLSDFQFKVTYRCVVQARTEVAVSLPSDPVVIDVTELGNSFLYWYVCYPVR